MGVACFYEWLPAGATQGHTGLQVVTWEAEKALTVSKFCFSYFFFSFTLLLLFLLLPSAFCVGAEESLNGCWDGCKPTVCHINLCLYMKLVEWWQRVKHIQNQKKLICIFYVALYRYFGL